MNIQRIAIPVNEEEAVSGVLSAPAAHIPGKGAGVIMAHGAGNDMDHPLMVTLADGLAEAGFVTLRFNFIYKEKGRRAPDSQAKLVLTWQSVYQYFKTDPNFRTDKIVAAGKSMGGRVASQMVADGQLNADRLVFLGYPLHAPGKKDKLRDAHLYRIAIPMLFFSGTRDPLCDLSLLKGVLKKLPANCSLETIEGGDHSFVPPKSSKTSQEKTYSEILKKTTEWLNI
jgi:predicted alpha/beta-hydrolase family hydrolase